MSEWLLFVDGKKMFLIFFFLVVAVIVVLLLGLGVERRGTSFVSLRFGFGLPLLCFVSFRLVWFGCREH